MPSKEVSSQKLDGEEAPDLTRKTTDLGIGLYGQKYGYEASVTPGDPSNGVTNNLNTEEAMIDRPTAIQKMHQIIDRAKHLKETHGLTFDMVIAFDYGLQGFAECINDVDAYELAFKLGKQLREMVKA